MRNLRTFCFIVWMHIICQQGFAQQAQTADSLMVKLESEKIIPSKDNSKAYIEWKEKLALLYLDKKNYDKAKENYTDLAAFYKANNDDVSWAETYNSIGLLEQNRSRYADAIGFFKPALEIFNRENENGSAAECSYNLGSMYSRTGELETALQLLNQSLEYYKSSNNIGGQGKCFLNIAIVYRKQSHYSESLGYFLQAKKIFEANNDQKSLAGCCSSLGVLYRQLSKFEEAEQNLHEAITIYLGQKSDRELAGAYYNLAIVFKNEPEYDSAFFYLSLAERTYNPPTDLLFAAMYTELRANLSMIGETYDTAIVMFRKAYEIRKGLRQKEETALNLLNLSYSFMHVAERTTDTVLVDSLSRYTSLLLDTVIDLATGLNNLYFLRTAYAIKRETATNLNNYKQALDFYTKQMIYNDSIEGVEKSGQIAEIQTKYETEKKDAQIELLSSHNKIQELKVNQQNAALLAASLESDKKQNEILLLNQSQEIQKLQLRQSRHDLEQKQAEAKQNAAKADLAKKDQQIKEQQLQQQKLLKNGLALLLVLILTLGLVFYNRIQLRKKLDQQNAILKERKRISTDMHDDLGSNLSKIALLSEVIKKQASDAGNNVEIDKISETARESLEKMSEIVWSLNSKNDKLENLVAYIRKFAVEYFDATSIDCKINMPYEIPDAEMSGEKRREIFLAVKEALQNVLKHSSASRVELSFFTRESRGEILIQDNGRGIDHANLNRFGNGLQNMKQRMESIDGYFSIENTKGTTVRLEYRL